MTIKGLGTDIVEIERVEAQFQRLGQRFADRILTDNERNELMASKAPARLLAKRFAVKEAVGKALGTGIGRGVSFQHIELGHNDDGAPVLHLSGGALARMQALGATDAHISLADERRYAVATVVLS
ncbi:holo-[acyl-carrier protein] synthase [Ferrimonas sediminum]|uniref:Holo-[acyl-carrier-protein] synthase n=1 Tax=Ferrimonas sediminum TaxID=718193 RepID=A0A1G8Q4S6_9GAMM|nr:holo-ACP synthase [Ferrimonas sediminum]SDI99701.1 holo-[acyl-carrier protein] synthase [Ferrimonas sediminum]